MSRSISSEPVPVIPNASFTSASVSGVPDFSELTINVEAMEITVALAGADSVKPSKIVPEDASTVELSVIATSVAF